MVLRCVLCKNKPWEKNVSFHSFPCDLVTRAKWLKFCGLKEREIVSSTKICSDHFLIEDFIGNIAEGLNRRVKKESVPSIKKGKKRRVTTVYFLPVSYPPQYETTIASHKSSSDGHMATTNEHRVRGESLQGSDPSLSIEFIADSENILSPGHNNVQEQNNPTYIMDQTPRNSRFEIPRYVDDICFSHMPTLEQVKVCEITTACQQPSNGGHMAMTNEHCASGESLQGSAPSSSIEFLPYSETILPWVHEKVPDQNNSTHGAAIDHTLRNSKFGVPRHVGDVCPSNMQTQEQTNISLNIAKRNVENQRRAIKCLQQKTKRLLKKTKTLQDLVKQLHKKNLITKEAADSILAI